MQVIEPFFKGDVFHVRLSSMPSILLSLKH